MFSCFLSCLSERYVWYTGVITFNSLSKSNFIYFWTFTSKTSIRNSSRLSSYSIYKRSFETEEYLNKVNINKFRLSLTKFKLSSHNLAKETGRYENVARENRLCTNCNLNVIENVYSFFYLFFAWFVQNTIIYVANLKTILLSLAIN
jgi:hypothetical protein